MLLVFCIPPVMLLVGQVMGKLEACIGIIKPKPKVVCGSQGVKAGCMAAA